jgi:hypothetical protein
MGPSWFDIICVTRDDIQICETMSYDSPDRDRSSVGMDDEQVRQVTCLKKP